MFLQLILLKRALLGEFFSSRRRHTRCGRDWSSDVCSSDLRRFTFSLGSCSGNAVSRGNSAHAPSTIGASHIAAHLSFRRLPRMPFCRPCPVPPTKTLGSPKPATQLVPLRRWFDHE